jgi:hypothetical protein
MHSRQAALTPRDLTVWALAECYWRECGGHYKVTCDDHGGFRTDSFPAKNWDEELCCAGYRVMTAFIREFVEEHLTDSGGVGRIPDLAVLTGCREEKFSLHIVCQNIVCDAPHRSMVLFVFEMARAFQKKCVSYCIRLLDEVRGRYTKENMDLAFDAFEGAEARFYLRALMLETTAKPKQDKTQNSAGEWVVIPGEVGCAAVGVDDTPFDEMVYSPRHLMRAAGACKITDAGEIKPAFAPVDSAAPVLVRPDTDFAKLFGVVAGAWTTWSEFLISTEPSDDAGCLAGMTPTAAYKSSQGWVSHGRRYPVEVGGLFPPLQYLGDRFADTRPRCSVTYDSALRRTDEFNRKGDRMGGVEVVSYDGLFMAEDGSWKRFHEFRPDDWIRHDHFGGGPEANASAKVFAGGFRCFGCNKTYMVPMTSPWEEPFEHSPTRGIVIISKDPQYKIPMGCEWLHLLSKYKYLVFIGPMGSGKTEQMARFILANKKARVLVLSFRVFWRCSFQPGSVSPATPTLNRRI